MWNCVRKWRKSTGLKLYELCGMLNDCCPPTARRLELDKTPTLSKDTARILFDISDGVITPNEICGITEDMVNEKKKLRKKKSKTKCTS